MKLLCNTCGELIEEGHKYCIKCGGKVNLKRCFSCNTLILDSDKYCINCGKYLFKEDTEADIKKPSPEEKKYASVLGIEGEITLLKVKKKYKELIFLYHPDRVNNTGKEIQELAERKTKEINEALYFFQKKYNFK